MRGRGFLISIEGLDRSGKTTQSRLLVNSLRRMGYEAIYTAEPSVGEIGHFIRRHILQRRQRIPAVIEAVLFAADRVDHVKNVIKPMLRKGKIIVLDRYIYSSLAYQGAAGLDLEWLMKINRFAPIPDLSIYIDVPLRVLARRVRRRRSVMEYPRIQREVRKVYMRLIMEGKIIPVDGNRSIKEVADEILRIVLDKLAELA